MRLFAGIPIVDQARREVVTLLARLRDTGWPVRWVHEDGLHLTLKFFGEVAPERLDVIQESVRLAGEGTGSLALRLNGLGAFPNPARARVVWLGIDAPAALALLHRRLEEASEEIGFPPEGRAFSPHVTLGRVRDGHRLPSGALEEFGGIYARTPFVGGQLVLYESQLTTEGPRYEAKLSLDLST